MTVLILASSSAIRAKILADAGVPFKIAKPDVDEDAIKRAGERDGVGLEVLAARLADAKALGIDASREDLVIGSDQILEFDGRRYGKPKDMAEARERLLSLQGKPHTLINAVSVARSGRIVWRTLQRPRLMMRAMTGEEIDAYLAAAGSDILTSVGAYQVERLGARLFERIDGDYFAVLGLSLAPLLSFLRAEGAIPF